MPREKGENASPCRDERSSEIGVWGVSDHDQECDLVLDDGRELVRLVADARVMRQGDPTAARDIPQPFVVRAIGREVIGVPLYAKSGVSKDGWKLQTEIAIREEDNTQATRSYRMASSISARLRS
jgi:hypothetical protein